MESSSEGLAYIKQNLEDALLGAFFLLGTFVFAATVMCAEYVKDKYVNQ